jgi:hypothetical protein
LETEHLLVGGIAPCVVVKISRAISDNGYSSSKNDDRIVSSRRKFGCGKMA